MQEQETFKSPFTGENTVIKISTDPSVWVCLKTGYATWGINKDQNPDMYEEYISSLPELYKSLIQLDEKNILWAPFIAKTDKAMIFVDSDEDGKFWHVVPMKSNDNDDPLLKTANAVPDMSKSFDIDIENFSAALYLFNVLNRELT